METSSIVRAARYHSTGVPAEVLQVDEISLPSPKAGEVQVQMIAAPINPADLNMLEGKYGEARPLPDVPGNEGAGRVVAVGDGVDAAWIGRIVLVDSEAWREMGNWNVDQVIAVDDGLDAQSAAFLRVNPPTAWRLLHDFAELKQGDWVIQNLATSMVGRAVIEIAKSKGWRTLNIVRRAESVEELKALGADAVLVDGPDMAGEAREILGKTKVNLGLNAVGGSAATRVAGLLGNGGTLVTYGAMSKESLKVPNGFLIFKDLKFCGFWLTRWLRNASNEAKNTMFGHIFTLAKQGAFRPKIAAQFPLADVAQAAARSSEGSGKVLLHLEK